MDVQRAEVEFVDGDISWFLDEFLVCPNVVEKVLMKDHFEEICRLKRALKYHEAFILEPWPILGGKADGANYGIGHCDVYIDLVGQFHKR